MDQSKEKNYIFDLKFVKILGLYQMLDFKTIQMCGYNNYHISIMILVLYEFTISMINVIFLYQLANDITAFMYYSGIFFNFLLSSYKIVNILYFSEDLWKCMVDITNCNFLSYQHYNKNVFKIFRSITILVLYIYAILTIVVIVVWTITTVMMNNTFITIRNRDGLYNKRRMSILNAFYMVPNDMYDNNFNILFIVEIILLIVFDYFICIFLNIIIIMCSAFSSQLETICNGIASLGYKCSHNNSGKYKTYYINTIKVHGLAINELKLLRLGKKSGYFKLYYMM